MSSLLIWANWAVFHHERLIRYRPRRTLRNGIIIEIVREFSSFNHRLRRQIVCYSVLKSGSPYQPHVLFANISFLSASARASHHTNQFFEELHSRFTLSVLFCSLTNTKPDRWKFNYPTNFFAVMVELWPPKPKELFTMALTGISRAVFGT